MTSSFSRRLMLESGLAVGGLFALLAIALAVILFADDVRNLNGRIASVAARVPEAFRVYDVPAARPGAGAHAIVRQADTAGLLISVANTQMRVLAIPPRAAGGRTTFVRRPKDRAEPGAPDQYARSVDGLATAFGLIGQHVSLDGLDVTVVADPEMLGTTISRFGLALLVMLLVTGGCAYGAARVLKREALRPLHDVVDALEAFAAGDLRPRPVKAVAASDELGRLSAAYNGAVAQVAAAFSQRDHAEAEMQRFIEDAAHQLRTPLTVIQGFIGILLKNAPQSEADRVTIMQAMDRQSRSMAGMIEKLMVLDRYEAVRSHPQLMDIGDGVEVLVRSLTAALPVRDLALSCEAACYAFVDPGEIRDAISNVVENALKYAAPAEIAVSVRRDGDDVAIVVADRGPGIGSDDREHVFDRFYRGEQRDVVGSGLGLAITKRAVERAGGRVALESERGRGTTVTVRLPYHAADARFERAAG